jgi:hypothetical protein
LWRGEETLILPRSIDFDFVELVLACFIAFVGCSVCWRALSPPLGHRLGQRFPSIRGLCADKA